ncbi:fluoride efflux transporter CrcB [Solimonas soli]|uniref:fluoride efflux transporter CrcB n=1 Tax=Solimonas soli TaxID=413479 RepID=UPI000480A5EB|nr:fluoride efflux transporter CrcB [Solimonas soli]
MGFYGILAVGVGAALGAWLRWLLGLALNHLFTPVPPGTLAANLIGGYIIGAALGVFTQIPGIAPEWRLLIITGFCGGLTTFSTFSAEIALQLQQGRLGTLALAIILHVAGSLMMTLLGIWTAHWLLARPAGA